MLNCLKLNTGFFPAFLISTHRKPGSATKTKHRKRETKIIKSS